ncbi:histidine phosphatase family protein [Vibrio ezurae]|uniref:Phosphoglycerate mutase family protein n=1 Tax=Vibrio ezurae NBRC 102218 TaxID=1219080 RepID=U3ALY4_9VIBR|nr:histidine phosphatase family protein [Vibrio ezurae]GAD80926.1 phosphoglycerate mutase family protein [Vibrio ezurae NBRC 102218]
MKHLKLWVLRHGQCEGGNILRGQVDVLLSQAGHSQMDNAFSTLPQLPTEIISSPLQRCAIWSNNTALDKQLTMNTNNAFTEMNFGDWDGKTFDELYQNSAEKMDAFWRNPWDKQNSPPNGETLANFELRVLNGLSQLLSQHTHQGTATDTPNSLLLVTHGGVIKVILGHILNAQQSNQLFSQLTLPYAARLEVDVYFPDTPTQPPTEQTEPVSIDSVRQQLQRYQFNVHWPSI